MKVVSPAPVPFTRQLSIPVTRAHAYQMQFAQNKTAHVNGDLGHSPTSGSGPVVPQVKQLWFRKTTVLSFIY